MAYQNYSHCTPKCSLATNPADSLLATHFPNWDYCKAITASTCIAVPAAAPW